MQQNKKIIWFKTFLEYNITLWQYAVICVIRFLSDNVVKSGLQFGLELEAFSAVCERVIYCDAALHRLDADKGLFFLSFFIIRTHSYVKNLATCYYYYLNVYFLGYKDL